MRSFKILVLLFLFSVLATANASAQRRRGYSYTEIGYLANINGSTPYGRLNAFRISTGLGKMVTDKVSLGFAITSDSYSEGSSQSDFQDYRSRTYFNVLPITLNAAYFINPDLSGVHLDLYGGYAPAIFRSYNQGFNAGAGVAYGFRISPGFIINAQTGYNYQQLDTGGSGPASIGDANVSTIRISVGLMFH
ncbi:hypothetical protein GS399_01250 [Pedobacter sp. HMF7647]|uniref:Outer membrane beta-barrel protein n=1 Tax=Hufsiella arboris TaxID=2695275 RepID=A0A7K1Y4S7_9SPHI|nr:outer membrane beta-barrel protein [Hufsiella arboris]MXV49583.1 hypothetical protein [Hufsiella arboris]